MESIQSTIRLNIYREIKESTIKKFEEETQAVRRKPPTPQIDSKYKTI
jgi:hypothetical protein